MFSERFILKLLSAASALLSDNCLEPHIGQEDGNGDFDYFAQKIGRKEPPTERQAQSLSIVSGILEDVVGSLNGSTMTEEECKGYLRDIYGYDLDRDDFVATPNEVYLILGEFKEKSPVNEVMKRALAEWIAEKVSRISDNDLWTVLDRIYNRYNEVIEEREEHFTLLSSAALLEQQFDLRQLRLIKRIVEEEMQHCHGFDL